VNTAAKNKGPTYDEYTAMKTRCDRAERQSEEFKKANQNLMEKLNDSKKDRGTNNAALEDLKKRLEAAMNLATTSKRDAERFATRAEALQKEEMRLRIELGKALEEIKKLKIAKAQAALARPGVISLNQPTPPAGRPAGGTGGGFKPGGTGGKGGQSAA